MKIKNENEIWKDVESGKYRDFYIIYDRKSTDELENQKNSLKFQKIENLHFAKRNNFKIAQVTILGFCADGVISEKHSAYKEDEELVFNSDGAVNFNVERPKFLRLMQLLNKKLFKGVIFLTWDRASRNPADDLILKRLMKAGIKILFTLATYDETSSGNLHQDIDGMFSQHHSRVTSEKVRLSSKKNRSEGKCTYKAPVGYLNVGTMEHKPFDPVRAPFVKRFFELADEGWSLSDIAKWAVEQGFTMPPSRKKRTSEEMLLDDEDDTKVEKICIPPKYTTIQKILRNRFFTGMLKNADGIWIKSTSHEPMVEDVLFFSVQEKLTKKNKSKKYDVVVDAPFRAFFTCRGCTRSYTPYYQKGSLYLGSKCKVGCKNPRKNFSTNFITVQAQSLIEKLYFTDKEIEDIEMQSGADIILFEKKRHREIEQMEGKKKKLREDLAYLRGNKLTLLKTGVYTPEQIVESETSLESEINSLIESEQVSEEAMRETVKDLRKLSELLKNVIPYWKFANPEEKQSILRIIFSELIVYENTLDYKLTIGFEPFKTRFVSVGAGGETRTLTPCDIRF